ncbi:MAG: hypothetical protein A2915_03000 [Candidatus Yanofskybacteria bacterium RIFCSPLOWO2_01_FULL_41_34]|uniref:Phosphatidylglycerol lysyltransferase C-terminal domain-containing protein n=1 Tax=Candidatus Yanofskybacteria bacterium RIFCSPHIGHO2_01_FULL_41_26 TaxID=1802661 RepID=A0A1F8EE70_9BACT|nr:MAG: hypothetical protein A2649_00895 [Candidatus Yanofskybacteria bacterium RIFCSPHIGHO2_01_FULL_41_26]OGN21003.1 MAG: hypothetical protein A2915_03000 [Candidatus Yanofskybacteria bacterium RIFCSPLOWO2_01_FULL_41_34]
MKLYENIEDERDRIQACINKFGHTSDHNLDWWACSAIDPDSLPVFVEWSDGIGLLAHHSKKEWRIWSDPVSPEKDMAETIGEFALEIFKDKNIEALWCDDISDKIYPELKKNQNLKLNDVYYSLQWPVLNMLKYDPNLPGSHFKDIRNARNKFYREHKVEVVKTDEVDKKLLHAIVDEWKNVALQKQKEDVYDLKYHKAIDNNFRGFLTARVLVAGGVPVGFNAGYEVVNSSGRFAGVIGINNYSINDLGLILWLEDLEWIKNAGYKELDMQGDEDGGLKFKMQFNPVIERKTDTFCIKNNK